jgi:hypothetical protein
MSEHIDKEIEKLNKEIDERSNEIIRLQNLKEIFPDIKQHTNRWKRVRYYSATVNSIAEDCDIGHNCGCCPDSPVEVWPFVKTENGNVYSDPPKFDVGEKYNYRDRPHHNWKEILVKAGISEVVIEKVANHFKIEKEEMLKELEESYNDVDR